MLNNSRIRALFLFSAVLLALGSRAAAEEGRTRVSFLDQCSDQQTYVLTPNGVVLMIDVTSLTPSTYTDITIEYVPAGLTEDLIAKHRIVEEYAFTSSQRGELHLPLYLPNYSLDIVESKIPGHNIWNVNVSWRQSDRKGKTHTGNGNSSILRISGQTSFFKVKSETTCIWETPPSINSDYYYNELTTSMLIHREVTLYSSGSGFRGFSFGSGPTTGGDAATIPLATGKTSMPGFGWFFGDWSAQRSLTINMEVRRDWNLAKNQGGFFFDRFSFHRVEADRYEWVQPRRACGYYAKTASGTLDLGSRMSEFNSVPLSYSGSPVLVSDFMEKVRPTRDTCRSGVSVSATRADYLVSSDRDNMIFFYPNLNSTNPNQGE